MRYGWLVYPACLLLLSAGCAGRETAPFSSGEVPEQYAESGGRRGAEVRIGRWWEDFRDPRLTALVEAALADNLDLRQAEARLARARAVADAAGARLWPGLDFSGWTTRAGQPSMAGTVIDSTYRLSLAAGYEIDLWGRLADTREAARLQAAAAREDLRTAYLTVTANLADLYYLAVEQRAQLALLDQMAESWRETVYQVRRRYERGLAPASELYQARQALAVVRARQPEYERRLATAQHALAVLAGRYPEPETGGDLAELPPVPEAYPAGLPATLLDRRPDITAALLRVQARDREVAAAIADRFPSFNLLADYGLSRGGFGMEVVDLFYSVAANAGVSIFDGGRRQAAVERQQALLAEEIARCRQTVLRAFQEVEDALAANRTSEERSAALAGQEVEAGHAYRLARDEYFHGQSNYLPVLIAQRHQLETAGQLLAARRRLIADRLSLIRALGGTGSQGTEIQTREPDTDEVNPR